jgi:hypothetical protein
LDSVREIAPAVHSFQIQHPTHSRRNNEIWNEEEGMSRAGIVDNQYASFLEIVEGKADTLDKAKKLNHNRLLPYSFIAACTPTLNLRTVLV